MTKKVYYIENTTELDTVLAQIDALVNCFIHREFIEMDWSELTIRAKDKDLPTIEYLLAPVM